LQRVVGAFDSVYVLAGQRKHPIRAAETFGPTTDDGDLGLRYGDPQSPKPSRQLAALYWFFCRSRRKSRSRSRRGFRP
jgi:hypothetical protein